MSAVTITGARGTGNVSAGLLKPDIDSMAHELEPNSYPFTVITRTIQHEPTHNADFSWFEDTLEPRSDTSNGAVSGTSNTSIPVHNGSYFAQHDHWRNMRTGEVIRVASVSSNTVTAVRGIGNSGTGVAILDADEWLKVGAAQEEGDTARPARSGNPSQVTNYAQITRNSVSETETMRNTDTYLANDWDRVKGKKFIEHQKDIEASVLFGKPNKDTTGTHPRRTTGGALYYITTNVTAAGGTLSESAFYTWARSAFRYGSKTKLLLASRLLVDVLNGYARGKVQVPDQGINSYGVRIFKLISPHGDINMVVHDMLSDSTTLNGYGILLDVANLKFRPLQNRDTNWYPDRQQPDADLQLGEWITEAGVQFANEKTDALLTGVTG